MKKVLSVLKKYPVSTVLALVIFLLCIAKPPSNLPKLSISFTDKIAHFLVYFVLAVSMVIESRRNKDFVNIDKKNLMLKFIAVGVIFGIFIEFVQGIFPYRYFELGDILANSTGSVLGVLILTKILKK